MGELEAMCRHNLPITVVIVNNNGIYQGVDTLDPSFIPPTVLIPRARYEKIADAFGGKGFFVDHPDQLKGALDEAMASKVPTIVNIMIAPAVDRKPQKFNWLSTETATSKL